MTDPVLIHAGPARAAGRRWGVDPADILAILSVEGGTDPRGRPVAPADRMGPPSFGQFTYGTGAALGVRYGDSRSETDAIARYLVKLGYKTDRERAIAAYNGGPGNPQPAYAAKVDRARGRYAGLSQTASGTASTDSSTSSSAGLFGTTERSGAVRALTYTTFTAAGIALAGIGLTRTLGLRGGPA